MIERNCAASSASPVASAPGGHPRGADATPLTCCRITHGDLVTEHGTYEQFQLSLLYTRYTHIIARRASRGAFGITKLPCLRGGLWSAENLLTPAAGRPPW